jgi:hypothetical protein
MSIFMGKNYELKGGTIHPNILKRSTEDPTVLKQREEQFAAELKNGKRSKSKFKLGLGLLGLTALASGIGGYKIASDRHGNDPTYAQGYRDAKTNVAAMSIIDGDVQKKLGISSEGVTNPMFSTDTLKCYTAKTKKSAQVCLSLVFGEGLRMVPTSVTDADLDITIFGRGENGLSIPAKDVIKNIKKDDCKTLLELLNTDVAQALRHEQEGSVQYKRSFHETHFLDGGDAMQAHPINVMELCK